jgi:nucleotide-binding universal stress UspA family protein
VWVRKEALTLDQKKVAAALDDVEHETAAVIERIRPNLERAGFDLAKVRVEIRAGGVADAIVEACEESKPDLVVMGTHGRQGMKDHVLGSTTERVLARVNASVFAVRPIGYPFLRE